MNTAPTIHGNRIILRALRETDRSVVVESHRDPEFLRLVGADREDIDIKNASNVFEQALADPSYWAITENRRCIGTAFLHSLVKNDRRARYAIGIFEPTDWGKGLGAETTRLVLDFAFRQLGLHRVDVRVLEYNERAIRCYEKCGFVREHSERESAWVNGRWHNDLIMGILEHEYGRSS